MIADNARLIVDMCNALAGVKGDRGHIVQSSNRCFMSPLVSILIPCYNARPWIAQCIQSAIDQTYPHKEIVVVDDGSTDGSLDVIRDFSDRIRFETGPNRGGNVARNRLIELSRGSWLSFLDADDYLLPEKIKRQMTLIASNGNIDVVYSPLIELIQKTGRISQRLVEDDDLYANYIRWVPFSSIAPLWRKSAILEVGGWNPNQPVCQEHELLLRLIMAGKRFELSCEPLSVYRKVDSSISRRWPLSHYTRKAALTDQLEAYLVASGKLKGKHRLALGQVRFEDARTTYAYDKEFAENLIRKIYETQDGFYPSGDRAPFLYRVAFKTFGFRISESIAATVRKYRRFPVSARVTIVQCNCGAEYRRTKEKFLVPHNAICAVCGAALESWSESTHVSIYELVERPDRKPD